MLTSKNYYKILGINPKATADEIKKAYRKLAHQYHPDKNKAGKAGEENYRLIKEAYEVLSDPRKKAEFDFILKQPAVSPYAFSREIKNFNRPQQLNHIHPAPIVNEDENLGKSKMPAWLMPVIFIVIAFITVQIIMRTNSNEDQRNIPVSVKDSAIKDSINNNGHNSPYNKLPEKPVK